MFDYVEFKLSILERTGEKALILEYVKSKLVSECEGSRYSNAVYLDFWVECHRHSKDPADLHKMKIVPEGEVRN